MGLIPEKYQYFAFLIFSLKVIKFPNKKELWMLYFPGKTRDFGTSTKGAFFAVYSLFFAFLCGD